MSEGHEGLYTEAAEALRGRFAMAGTLRKQVARAALAPAVRRIEELEREIDRGREAARYYVSEISRKDHVITAAEGRAKQLEDAARFALNVVGTGREILEREGMTMSASDLWAKNADEATRLLRAALNTSGGTRE